MQKRIIRADHRDLAARKEFLKEAHKRLREIRKFKAYPYEGPP